MAEPLSDRAQDRSTQQFFTDGAQQFAQGAAQFTGNAAQHVSNAALQVGGGAGRLVGGLGGAAQNVVGGGAHLVGDVVKGLGAPVDQLSHLLAGLNRQDGNFSRWMTKTLQKTVLKPHYYLRRQLFLSFGTTAFAAISFFIFIGITTSILSGESVMKEAKLVQEELATYTLGTSARYVAETITKKFHNFQTASDILMQATQDRIAGYKSRDFFESDLVPFEDYDTGQRMYPLDTPDLIQMDWNSTTNLHTPLDEEIHLQGRHKWYDPDLQVTTAHAAWFMAHSCDPDARPGDPGYLPNCTPEDNNLQQPDNEVNWYIYNRAKDLSFLLKALYESHPVAKQIGIYFANGGAGSYVKFPSHIRDGRQNFSSIGCDWGTNINPLTGDFLLNAEERSRCHREPGSYGSRTYNPLERPWCMRQAMAPPGRPVNTGPYLDASSGRNEDLWVLTFGHGVFDRLTREFIGCTLVDVSVDTLQETLNNFQIGSTSAIALVRWDNDGGHSDNRAGAVVACGQCHLTANRTENDHIMELQEDFGIDLALWTKMRKLVDYNTTWDPKLVKKAYEETLFPGERGRLVMMYPVPYLPNEYSEDYYPSFMVVVSISEEEIYGDIEEMNAVVRRDIRGAILGVCVVGMIGLAVIFAFLTWISRTLTKPLLWMQESTAQVINNAGSEDLANGFSNSVGTAAGLARCSPKTEVTVLLSEFNMMMDGFSGKGAAEIADSKVSEVQNKFQWREAYQVLYPYNFRTGGIEEDSEDGQGRDGPQGAVIDLASVKTEMTVMSALTILSEYSVVQAITKPYHDMTASLSKSIAELATASYTAGFEKLPGWAQTMLSKDDDSDDMPDYVVSPPFVNRLKNLRDNQSEDDIRKKSIEVSSSSRVFLWVSFGIQIPLLLTATAVITLNEIWIRQNLDKWLTDVRTASFLLEQDAIVTATLARSIFGQEVMARFMRDLHLYSRTAGWLLFGAISRSSAFTKMRTAAQECKSYPKDPPSCPYILNDIPCACDWSANHAGDSDTCTVYPEYGLESSRYFQTETMEGQKLDIDPATGNRPRKPNRTVVTDDPSNTQWWGSFEEMPGSEKGQSAAGYETTYDRVRVLSALAAIEFPMFNYFPGRDENVHLGSYVGVEADGMMIGFSGCSQSHANYPSWRSTDSNLAYEIEPLLCPNGTYGYDCRCRGWFAQAAVNDTYISPPYSFAGSSTIGTTAASAIRDTSISNTVTDNSDLVAVVGLDFLPEAFTNALGPDRTIIGEGESGFAFVITPDEDVNGGNTVFGPNYDVSEGAMAIEDVVLPQNKEVATNIIKFNYTINQMSRGKSGNTTFIRTRDDEQQSVFVAYAPVYVDVWRPLDNRDFAAGCASSQKLVYSLGIAVDESDLYLRYEDVEDRVDVQLNIARGISIAAMVLIAMFVIMLTYYISLNITRPIIALTMIVKSIKNKSLRDEIPDVQGGSREVSFVHQSFQRLMKVVRFANTAFFAGDRTESYHSMEDALNLFLKLGNQKAIGVAYNNLGTMVLQEQMESHGTGRLFDNSLFGICISEIYNVGITYFDEAVRHGSFEYEISKDTDDQGSYAKQLANRYFNRGMFLVVVRHHPLCPSWIQEDGVSDILRAKELDLEVLQFLHKHDLFEEHEVHEFESLLRRTRGILALVRNYGFNDPWGIDSLIEQAQTLLNEAGSQSNLFNSMSRVGRAQQLDDLRIQNALCKGDHYTAGKIAMRMLVEDQYIIDTIIVNALTAVKQYFETEGIRIPRINATQYLQRETRKAQVNVLREAKNVFFCLDYSGSMAGERMERANKNLLWVYEEHCSDKDMVGFIRFNHDIDDQLWFPLGKKGDWGQVQEAVLKLATDAEGGTRLYAALNRCVTQILKTETKNDTWIIALTDGESSWDHPAKSVVERIKKSNKKRDAKIHVIIIGFEVPASVIKTCEIATSVTDKSVYVDARGGLDEMDKAFEQVVSVIGGSAITMETF